MTQNTAAVQESRTEAVTVRLTQSEKDAVDMVVKVHRPVGGVGELLRARSLEDVITEGRGMLDRLRKQVRR